MDHTYLASSLLHLLEACEAANRQILILTPNDYSALIGKECKPLYERLLKGEEHAEPPEPGDAVQIDDAQGRALTTKRRE